MSQYGVRLAMSPGWLELPAGGDIEAWARQAAADIWAAAVGAAAAPGDDATAAVAALADHLIDVTSDSQSRRPLLAAALLPDPAGPVAAMLEAWQLAPEDGVPFEPDSLARQQQSESRDTTAPPEVSIVTLACGPAVRVHRTVKGPRDRGFRRTLVEELTYLLLPTAIPGEGLVVTGSWLDLSAGEARCRDIDAIVAGIGIDVVD